MKEMSVLTTDGVKILYNILNDSSNEILLKVVEAIDETKMDKKNPIGTGTFALNAAEDSSLGSNSTTLGKDSAATGYAATAEGYGTNAGGYAAHAEGSITKASGYYSHAEGFNTESASMYQHVQGANNIIDSSDTYLHIVGNGSNTSSRSNAHTLDKKGNAWFAGNVYVGSQSGTHQDENSDRLAKISEILKISDLSDLTSIVLQQAKDSGQFDGVDGKDGSTGLQGPQGERGPQGPQGEQGPQGPQGQGITIRGTYSTLSDLTSDHPTSEDGDCYLVGPTLYIYSLSGGGYISMGQLQVSFSDDFMNYVSKESLANGQADISLINSYTDLQIIQDGNVNLLIKYNVEWKTQSYVLGNNIYDNKSYACTSTYIPCLSSTPLRLFNSSNGKSITIYHCYFYDSDYTQLSYVQSATSIEPPEGVSYVRFCVIGNDINSSESGNLSEQSLSLIELYQQGSDQYNPGKYSEKEVFKDGYYLDGKNIEDNSIELSKLSFVTSSDSINLFDPSTYFEGYYCNTGQAINKQNTNALYGVTSAISVKPGDKISLWRLDNSLGSTATKIQCRFIVGYDIFKKEVSSAFTAYVKEYTVPSDVYYIRVTFITSELPDPQLGYIQRHEDQFNYQGYRAFGEKEYLINEKYLDLTKNEIHIALPPEICVPSGYTIELYNSQCVLEHNKYHLQWVCDYGVNYGWKYSLTGYDSLIGKTKTLVLNVLDNDMNLIESASTTVYFVAKKPTKNQLIIPIGDSLTNQKSWLSTLHSTFTDGEISFRGTRGTTDPKLVNGITHEGRSGATTDWYNLGTSSYTFDSRVLSTVSDGTTNPFWNSSTNAFDFDYYCNSKSDGGAGYFQDENGNNISLSPTGVMIYLGTNGVQIDPTKSVNNIVTLINNIRKSEKGVTIPIYVVNTLFRAPIILSTGADGFATNNAGEYKFLNDIKHMNLMKALNKALENYGKVYIIPIATTHDSEHNFPFETKGINPYNDSMQYNYFTDTVHPSESGYKQMAATMLGSIIAHGLSND